MSVFVIINEWLPTGSSNSSSEIVGGKAFFSESDAWDALRDVANAHHLELDRDETNFVVEDGAMIEFEEYYIEELTRG